MLPGNQDLGDRFLSMGSDLPRPAAEPLRGPFQIPAVVGRQMVFCGAVPITILPHMMGNALLLVVNGHGVFRGPDQDFVLDIGVRDAVVVLLEGDMVVDVHFGPFDLDVFERPLWQRLQGLFFQFEKQLLPGILTV